jgi:hypothetical protein
VRYVENATIDEDMLFCKRIRRIATARKLFKTFLHFIKAGLQILIKRSAVYDTS